MWIRLKGVWVSLVQLFAPTKDCGVTSVVSMDAFFAEAARDSWRSGAWYLVDCDGSHEHWNVE